MKTGRKTHLLGCAMLLISLVAHSSSLKDLKHVFAVTSDSLLLVSGSTYRYTVDTPEDGGLVDTGLTVEELQQWATTIKTEVYTVFDAANRARTIGRIQPGDRVEIKNMKGSRTKLYVGTRHAALQPQLVLHQPQITVDAPRDITLDFFAGQRSPMAKVELWIPTGIRVTLDNTTVNVIGRGEVTLRELPRQSIGRTGTHYSYNRVGHVTLTDAGAEGTLVSFSGLDLRPENGPDMRLCFRGVKLSRTGSYSFRVRYITSEPEVYSSPVKTTLLTTVNTVADFSRETLRAFTYNPDHDFTTTTFTWSPVEGASDITLMQSADNGKNWKQANVKLQPTDGKATVSCLRPHTLYTFKLVVKGGKHKGESNLSYQYTGRMNVRSYGVKGDGKTDDTQAINLLLKQMHRYGGGVVLFPAGTYNVRTLHIQSNVWLYVDKGATIQALPGADAPEVTWFSDRAYRSGLSPTDPKPYSNPENWLTKQDVGHTYFRNTMFFGERLDNVKIVGTGRITGNGHLFTGDGVMNNDPGKRADKMFTFKLCTNIEIGGLDIRKDMWYDPGKDVPYYIDGTRRLYDDSNMLHIDQGGHFVLLATGTDGIHVHDTYFAKYNRSNVRDIYDFMACNDVTVTNIYSVVSSDDIVKPGSDCSLGFTRPARNYRVRNIVGDTNCNLFQIGSETADDIQDLYIDNIYVLGANKAGFSISTNDGGHIKNVYLNSGKTGPIHSRSVMHRTRTPFFISISNRGRVLGADVAPFTFTENGVQRKELLVTNVNIGQVENIIINGVDITEVYGGSSFRKERWKAYDGSQNEATPIIAGFKLPDPEVTEGGLTFRLPNGIHTGYIKNVQFVNVNLLVKGGHPREDANAFPPEIGVGRYNVGDLKVQPSFGYWARHVGGLLLKNCKINAEKPDGRYPVVLDDVHNATIENLQVTPGISEREQIKEIGTGKVTILNAGNSHVQATTGR